MAQLRLQTYIEASPAYLFALHTDVRRIPEWFPGATTTLNGVVPASRVGTCYSLHTEHFDSRWLITRTRTPELHGRQFQLAGLSGRALMRFVPTRTGTQVDYDVRYRCSGIRGWLMARWRGVQIIEAYLRAEMEYLRAFAERTTLQGVRS